jgi:hypothetical protein
MGLYDELRLERELKESRKRTIILAIMVGVAMVVFGIFLIYNGLKGLDEQKKKSSCKCEALIADLRNELKEPILDLAKKVEQLDNTQAGIVYREKMGYYDPEKFCVQIPKLKIGGCMGCH